MTNTQPQWLKIRITGALEVMTPLHIGSGETEIVERKKRKADTQSDSQTCLVSNLCEDANGLPYLPATSLRGALSARLNDSTLHQQLFGSARMDQDNGVMGKLRCYDATIRRTADLVSHQHKQQTGVSINPLLGVAEAHKLFTHNTVPEGSIFELTLELDNANEDELEGILNLLASLNGRVGSGLGAGKSKDQGQLLWTHENIEVIDADALRKWVSSGGELKWRNYDAEFSIDPKRYAPTLIHLPFTIQFHTPWLIDDPALHETKQHDDDNPPNLEFSRDIDGRAKVPASSLKGWLRGHARRILLTLLTGKNLAFAVAEERADELLAEIFGDTRQAAWLVVSDALSSGKVAAHKQQFVAIDRFTGGNKKGALYGVNAVSPADVHGNLGIKSNPNHEGDWRVGLLTLLARDAMEGDMNLGWGKSRGYGQATLRLTLPGNDKSADWPQVVETYETELQGHLRALHAKLDPSTEESLS